MSEGTFPEWNPEEDTDGEARTVRGGSWNVGDSIWSEATSAYRDLRRKSYSNLSFRCVSDSFIPRTVRP